MSPQGPASSPAPSPTTRLLWWLGIYFAAQLPLLIYADKLKGWLWFAFPLGMGYPFSLLLAGVTPPWIGRAAQTNGWIGGFFELFPLALPFIIYLVHLILTCRVQKRRHFLLLMWILGAIVLFNLASCADFIRNPPE